MPHTVAVLLLEQVVPSDVTVPCDLFRLAWLADGQPAYRVLTCGQGGSPVPAGPLRLTPSHDLGGLSGADTIIVPGREDFLEPAPPAVLAALRAAVRRGARVASVCVGAFTLAEAGLLDGQRATTHWLAAGQLAARYPAIAVDPDVLFVDNGQILTAAGAAAAQDLCLHIIRRDHGLAVAADSSRRAVMPLERPGGQAQFIVHEPPPPDGASLAPLLHWIEENLRADLRLPALARQAAMSQRSLHRRFLEQTQQTPAQWIARARLRRAQHLLQSTALPVAEISDHVGFGSPSTMRARFRELLGRSPRQLR